MNTDKVKDQKAFYFTNSALDLLCGAYSAYSAYSAFTHTYIHILFVDQTPMWPLRELRNFFWETRKLQRTNQARQVMQLQF